ncbi:MAG: nucleoside hydrolase [Actinomycetaceae bacterium]|nr:nucleoside hydrolase [Actinomycetaceae bacterium]
MTIKIKEPKRIVIDTDPGVDDAVAILLALKHPNLQVEALTTVAGNVDVEHTTTNALGILKLAGRSDIPVYRGADKPLERKTAHASDAHGDTGLGGVALDTEGVDTATGEAAQFIVDYTREHPDEITLVPIGPLTNIAKAVTLDPSIVDRVPELVIMGGAEFTGNITPSAEFNFWYDPHAADIVMRAGFKKITMVGLDATSQAFMSPGTRDLLRRLQDPIAQFIYDITEEYADFYWERRRLVGAELCDALAVAAMVDEAVLEFVDANVEICVDGLCEGRSVVARTERYRDRTKNAAVGTRVDTKRFFELLLNTLFPEHEAEMAPIITHEYR